MNEGILREYLLGRLTESERHEIENGAFEDDAFEDRLREAEYDLLDDWARGEVSEADRAAIERRFSAEKLAVARSLRRLPVAAPSPGKSLRCARTTTLTVRDPLARSETPESMIKLSRTRSATCTSSPRVR